MSTEWKWRLMLFIRAQDNTPANRQTFAAIFANNGSGEDVADEAKIYAAAARFSASGAEPAQVFGIETAAKTAMKDALQSFIASLTNARYVVVANTDLPNWNDGELVATNFPVTPNGQIVRWADVLQYLENEFGMVRIPPEPDPA